MILIKLIFDAVRNRAGKQAGREAGRRILRSLFLELDSISDTHHL
jgi:hypothetical protein